MKKFLLLLTFTMPVAYPAGDEDESRSYWDMAKSAAASVQSGYETAKTTAVAAQEGLVNGYEKTKEVADSVKDSCVDGYEQAKSLAISVKESEPVQFAMENPREAAFITAATVGIGTWLAKRNYSGKRDERKGIIGSTVSSVGSAVEQQASNMAAGAVVAAGCGVLGKAFEAYNEDWATEDDSSAQRLLIGFIKAEDRDDNFDLISHCLRSGSSVDKLDKDGRSPLHYAAKIKNKKILLALLLNSKKLDIYSREKYMTPLHCAALEGNIEYADMLVSMGSDINKKDLHGNTPAHIAAIKNNKDFIDFLVSKDADLSIKNNKGKDVNEAFKGKSKSE